MEENQAEITDKFLIKLQEYGESIAKREGYINYVIEKNNISSNGGSYMGALYEIKIKGNTENCEKETNIFVKNQMQSNIELIYSIPEIYKREHFVYTNLAKQFEELQNNVPNGEKYKICEAFEECNSQSIVLENLTAKGFKTWNRLDIISLDYAELAVKNIARFHSLTFVLEKCNPNYFHSNIKTLNCVYYNNETWKGFTENMKSFTKTYLQGKQNVYTKLSDIVNKYHSYMNDDKCIKTLCHGDYRHNNIMYREQNGTPKEMISVDYQISYYGNPVLDFIYLIFWGTDREFRRKHLNNLKNLYHEYMATFLEYFNIDIEEVFPKEYFEKQYKDKLDFGAIISVIYLTSLFPPEDDIPDLFAAEDGLDKMTVKVDPKFEERFLGIIDDFIEWGYL